MLLVSGAASTASSWAEGVRTWSPLGRRARRSRALKTALLLGLAVIACSLRVLEMTLRLLWFPVKVISQWRVASRHAREESLRILTPLMTLMLIQLPVILLTFTQLTFFRLILCARVVLFYTHGFLLFVCLPYVFHLNFRCGVIRS